MIWSCAFRLFKETGSEEGYFSPVTIVYIQDERKEKVNGIPGGFGGLSKAGLYFQD